MIDTSDKFMLVARIIDKVLAEAEVAPGPEPRKGMRRAHYFQTNANQLEVIKMIEAVYLDNAPAVEPPAPDMLQCAYCGDEFPEGEGWSDDQCQPCRDADVAQIIADHERGEL